jgi:AraC-like DNA-binding protein
MHFRSRRPHPSLAAYVDYYWRLSDAPKHDREHVAPSGTLEIVFNLHEDAIWILDPSDPERVARYSGAVVSGAHRGYFVIDTRAHAAIIGVHFRPGGAAPLLGVPPALLADRHADLEAIWGARAAELRDRLCAAGDVDEQFRILDGALMRRLDSEVRPRADVQVAMRRLVRANVQVGDVAAELAMSRRRLIEIFAAEVGVTPKVFSRIRRFKRAAALAKRSASPDWAQLAQACGYADQSHLVREFVSLSGLSPTALLRCSAGVKAHHAAAAGPRR